VFHDQPTIREKVTNKFQEYYKIQPDLKTSRDDLLRFLNSDEDSSPFEEFNSRKIPAYMARKMEGKLTKSELTDALFNKMHGNSAPGLDGFTVNWLRIFWQDLGTITMNALNDCFDNSGLTGLLKTAIVRLLRKGIKDPTIAGNYRPISLLSIHYKLASCAITQRIKPAVNIVVGRQQKAYVEGNVIGSCIINLLNMMHNVNEQKKASLILLIDFRKAFDSIDHKFITTVLTELGFKKDIVKWISIFFDSREAYILLGGHLSKKILLEQGVPQGDVISPYIFIIAVEILLIKVTYTKNLTGVTFGSVEGRSETFADDTTIYITRTPENLRTAIKYLKEFASTSGLHCNIEKTLVIPIGQEMDINEDNTLCPDLELTWKPEFTILGFTIDNKLAKLDTNFTTCNEKVKTLITKWRSYNLSINGRITIAKSILLPQYTYIGSVLDKISANRYISIQKTLDHFVLHNSYLEPNKTNKQWVKNDILYAEKCKGGYGQIQVRDFFTSIKCSWLKRYATDRINDHWCDILDLNFGLTPQSRTSIYKWGADKFEKVINLKLPCISEFVDSFRKFSIEFPNEPNTKDNRWLEQPFFHNPKIQFGRGWAKKPYTPKQFGLMERAATLSLGQLFVNLKPINKIDLENLGHEITILNHNSLKMHLKSHIGPGKTFNGCPKKIPIKKNPTGKIPRNLIDNIGDYMESFKKGSSLIRKILTKNTPKEIKIDMKKFQGKINSNEVSINQMKHCFQNLQTKFIGNDYLDYKSRAIHGKTQFNNSLAHYNKDVPKWCYHCLSKGIRTSEDFEHAVFRCPQVQFIIFEIKNTLELNCTITASNCVYSSPRPPEASKSELADCSITDMIWIICMKIFLKSRIEKSNLCDFKLKIELKKQLETITRNFPKDIITERINSLNLITKINENINQG
jgi:hypothetical protein